MRTALGAPRRHRCLRLDKHLATRQCLFQQDHLLARQRVAVEPQLFQRFHFAQRPRRTDRVLFEVQIPQPSQLKGAASGSVPAARRPSIFKFGKRQLRCHCAPIRDLRLVELQPVPPSPIPLCPDHPPANAMPPREWPTPAKRTEPPTPSRPPVPLPAVPQCGHITAVSLIPSPHSAHCVMAMTQCKDSECPRQCAVR